MHSSQFGITFTDSRGPVNSDGPIHCIRSLNRMVRYSVMPLPDIDWSWSGSQTFRTCTKPAPNPGFGVRCSWRAEPEPHLLFRFSVCPNPHLGFEPRCTSVHPFQCTYTPCSQFRDFWTQTAFLAHRKRK